MLPIDTVLLHINYASKKVDVKKSLRHYRGKKELGRKENTRDETDDAVI